MIKEYIMTEAVRIPVNLLAYHHKYYLPKELYIDMNNFVSNIIIDGENDITPFSVNFGTLFL